MSIELDSEILDAIGRCRSRDDMIAVAKTLVAIKQAAVAAERERCAKIAETTFMIEPAASYEIEHAKHIAAAIRAG